MRGKKKKLFRLLGRLCLTALIMGMMIGCPVVSEAKEESEWIEITPNQASRFVYHKHLGNEEQGGKCYGEAVYHSHIGNEEDGGDCFQTPVYHTHKGDEKGGGECYQTSVYHVHSGSASKGGACYKAVYHTHTDACYKKVSSSSLGCYIIRYWGTGEKNENGEEYINYEMSCGDTIYGTNSAHYHMVRSCGKDDEITSYKLKCGKTEKTVEKYAFSCEKLEGETIDAFQLSCPKTAETIDRYKLSCSKELSDPVGKLTVTEHQGKNKSQSELTAEFEDFTDGELELGENPFQWSDSEGSLGAGDRLILYQNGTYTVKVDVKNEDIDREGLQVSIAVKSIVTPSGDKKDPKPTKQPDPDKPEKDPKPDSDPDPDDGGGDGSDPAPAAPTTVPTPSMTPLPSETPTPKPKKEQGGSRADGEATPSQTPDTAGIGGKTPTSSPKLQEEMQTKKLEELQAELSEELQTDVLEKDTKKNAWQQFFEKPAVRVISITAGTLLMIGGVLLLLYLLRMSVRVYNDNGEGKMTYLGRCRVKLIQEGYMIEITDRMVEKAVTNKYMIRPGLFRLFREDEELLVCRRKKRISVLLDREMIVVIR